MPYDTVRGTADQAPGAEPFRCVASRAHGVVHGSAHLRAIRPHPLAFGERTAHCVSMIHRVLIVDDEPLARDRLSGMVRAFEPRADIRDAANGNDAVDVIRAWEPHLVFLDVQMPGRDGFEVAEAIGADRMPPTVFVTAFDAHAIRAFEVAAVDYLLKPFDETRFRSAWQRAATHQGLRSLLAESQRLAAMMREPTGGGPGRQLKVSRSHREHVARRLAGAS